jgi:hypothetical protein
MPKHTSQTKSDGINLNDKRVTIYIHMRKHEAIQVNVSRGPYAQYDDAFHFKYKPKGARKMRSFVEFYRPDTVIIEGWGHPEFDPLLRAAQEDSARRAAAWRKRPKFDFHDGDK